MSLSKRIRDFLPLAFFLVMGLSACVVGRGNRSSSKLDTLPPANGPWTLLPPKAKPPADSLTDTLGRDTLMAKSLERADSLGVDSLRIDSLQIDSVQLSTADSLKTDSITQPKKRANGIDDIIAYDATDSIVMLGTNMVYLFGSSHVDYKDKGLEAQFMRMNVDSNLVYAHYVLDSLGRPTAHPKFKDGDQSYEAKSMTYNFKTSKGFITGAVTQQGEGYVTAERTKKDALNHMYMEGGRYTTCTNHEHPHFYLNLTRAKVRPGKNIVAGPSYLVIGDIPLPIGLPFGFFPFSSSYSSGIIMPSYGEESNRGLYLREGGYYFALSDYIDLALTGDWYSRGSWGINARSTYRKRYRYSGNFSGSYIVSRTGDKDVAGTFSENRDFRISWSHSQDAKANPNSQFSANVNYSTSSFNHNSLNSLYNPDVSSQNTKNSSINYSRNFVGTPWRLSVSLDASQTSSTQQVALTSPNLSLSMSRIYPFKRKKRIGSERWYEKISLSYSGQLRNSITTHEDSVFSKSLIRDWRNGISHSIPISASYKLLDYIDLTLSANYNERWYSFKTTRRYDEEEQKVVREREYGFNRVYDFGLSANLSTTLYGFFKPWKLFGDKVQMIRHRITPSIGMSYRPDFGSEGWGFYRNWQYQDRGGNIIEEKYSLYEEGIFGTAGSGRSASINFSLDNNIEMKLKGKADSTGNTKPTKLSLIDNFSLSTSYNLAADSFRLSDISTRLAIKIPLGFTLNLSGSFDPYVYTHETNDDGTPKVNSEGKGYMRRLDKIRLLHGRGLGSLRQTGTSFSYTFNNQTFAKLRKLFGGKGEASKKTQETEPEEQAINQADNLDPHKPNKEQGNGSLYANQDDVQYDSDGYAINAVPWSISVNYGVNIFRDWFNPYTDSFRYRLAHSLMLSGNIQPTKNWSFNVSASYDFEAKKLANMSISISRDLHCWSFTANAIPIGPYKSYNFTVGVKSTLLRDLKYDKNSRSTGEAWY